MTNQTETDEFFMKKALAQAEKAYALDEVPVGAAVVKDGRVIAAAFNSRERKKTCLAHAEILAIEKACRKLGGWRLDGCELYVTLEPCAMCMGAAANARIRRVIFGAYEPKSGFCASVFDLGKNNGLNHSAEWTGGVLGEECSNLLKKYFKDKRSVKNT